MPCLLVPKIKAKAERGHQRLMLGLLLMLRSPKQKRERTPEQPESEGEGAREETRIDK